MAVEREDRLDFIEGRYETYNLEDLMSSKADLLGKGNLGSTYKVFLNCGEIVLVKRLKLGEFAPGIGKIKLQQLGEMVHENLLPIKAYMFSKYEKLLVSDYMPMGSLHTLLHGRKGKDKTPMDWETRMKIAYGVACGIEYLHSQGTNVCHGNIRSSNVILTDFYVPRLSEFGIAQLFPKEAKVNLSSEYCAPEVKCPFEVYQQGDVYSFGVLLLELLTGKAPKNAGSNEELVDLPKLVRMMFQGKPIIDVFDEGLRKYKKAATGEQMVQILQLAICCTFENPSKRPFMAAVTKRISKVCGF